jgi:hypothetical protein
VTARPGVPPAADRGGDRGGNGNGGSSADVAGRDGAGGDQGEDDAAAFRATRSPAGQAQSQQQPAQPQPAAQPAALAQPRHEAARPQPDDGANRPAAAPIAPAAPAGPAPAAPAAPAGPGSLAAPAAPASPAPPAALDAGSGQAPKAEIQAFLDEVSARKQPLAAHLEEAAALRFEAGCLSILLPPGDVYLSSRLRQPANRETVSAAVAKVWGTAARWDFSEGAPPSGLAAVRPDTEPENAALLNPAVQTLLDIFGGKVEAVEEQRGARED